MDKGKTKLYVHVHILTGPFDDQSVPWQHHFYWEISLPKAPRLILHLEQK